MTPDGGLLDGDVLDAAVVTGPPAASSLAQVLRPADGVPVPAEVVARLLAGIGLGAASAASWVEPSGRFRLGALEGRWRKDTASYVGAAAREAARQRRLAELDAELTRLDGELSRVRDGRAALAARRARVADEVSALPDDGAVRSAAAGVVAAVRAVDAAAERLTAAGHELERRGAALAEATGRRDLAASDLDLPPDLPGLEVVAEALRDYRVGLAALWPEVRAVVRATALVRDAAAAVGEVEDSQARLANRLQAAEHERNAAEAEHATLHDLVGAAVEEVQQRLRDTVTAIAAAEGSLEDLQRQVELAVGDVHAAVERQTLLGGRLAEQRRARAESVEHLRRLVASGVVEAALPGVELPDSGDEWAADPGVRLARDLDRHLDGVEDSDEAWERASTTITGALDELRRAMALHGAKAEGELRNDVLVPVTRYEQRTLAPHHLAGALDAELVRRGELLDAREREILENHLVSDVASHLSRLIADADETVKAMNVELASRPTGTGMILRLQWIPDADAGPSGLPEARARLLRQKSVMWSPEERGAVGRFLQAEINRVRAEDDTATWFEQLGRAFDYRRWHRFVIERRQGDGSWRRASGPASGGERALAVTLPLFAAASAHYSSARADVPRLVLLDEAFAGVDDAARRQCMSLLTAFDLDHVLTSEREWGCYPEVSGLSICHLVRHDGIDAVHVSRWEWDGHIRHEVQRPPDSAVAPARTPEPPAPGLFDEPDSA